MSVPTVPSWTNSSVSVISSPSETVTVEEWAMGSKAKRNNAIADKNQAKKVCLLTKLKILAEKTRSFVCWLRKIPYLCSR